MTYPKVLSEDETLDRALNGESLARYGDGELRLCVGGKSRSQRSSERLKKELVNLLRYPCSALICIPNVKPTPRIYSWRPYKENSYTKLYRLPFYGSSFISRPDSAPWINRPDYWDKIRQLWRDKNVTLVWEDKKTDDLSFTPDMMNEAANLREVRGPAQDAYFAIDQIEEEIGMPDGTVLLCLGAAATILAARLANKGIHAVDVGHAGTFMRNVDIAFKKSSGSCC